MQDTLTHKNEALQEKILTLIADLPPESLTIIEQFVRFIRAQVENGLVIDSHNVHKVSPPYLYPTVGVPASIIKDLMGIAPPVGGDALEDSEKLYNDD